MIKSTLYTNTYNVRKGLVSIIEIYYAGIRGLGDEKNWEKMMCFLCQERIEKINRYRKKEDKLRGVAAGLVLEYGLRKRGLSQKNLHFTLKENGKPEIMECPEMYFNLSHSGDYVAAAFADMPIGIDVEHFRESGAKIAERFFSEEERRYLKEQPGASSFTRIWTRKESYVKATGMGLRLPMDSFSTVHEQVEEDYYLKSFDILPDYWLSVCTKGKMQDVLIEKIDLAAVFCYNK